MQLHELLDASLRSCRFAAPFGTTYAKRPDYTNPRALTPLNNPTNKLILRTEITLEF